MNKLKLEFEIPIRYQVDVCVIGAGPGGCAAAVCAAENGAKTILLESTSLSGGMSTAGRVPVFMPVATGGKLMCEGFGRKVLNALKDRSAEIGFECGRAINAEHLKLVYEELLENAGVHLLYTSTLVSTTVEDGQVRQAIFTAPSGLFAVEAKIFVDGTGDGTLAARSGALFERGDGHGEVMPSTLCSVWAGVDWNAYRAGGCFSHNDDKMLCLLEEAFQNGELPKEDFHHTGLTRVSPHIVVGNYTHVFGIDSTDEESLTAGLLENRKLLKAYEKFYRKHIAGFADAEVIDSGSVLGVRESRRILGDYTLTQADHREHRHFDDEIGSFNFPADLHPPHPGKAEIIEHKKLYKSSHYQPGETYGIPYRVLLPQKLHNVLVCGRCVSTDRHMHASIRVIPGCYITGQAAGIAAALASSRGVSTREVPVSEIQNRIPPMGNWE